MSPKIQLLALKLLVFLATVILGLVFYMVFRISDSQAPEGMVSIQDGGAIGSLLLLFREVLSAMKSLLAGGVVQDAIESATGDAPKE